MTSLTAAHRGYEYQDLLVACRLVDMLLGTVVEARIDGVTWNPQNEALLQWFAGVQNSDAIHKAYSYPDTTVLTAPAVPQNPACTPPLP